MHVWHRDLAVVEHCHAGTGAVMWPTKKITSKYFHRRHRNEKRGGGKLVFFNQPLITFTDG